MFSELAQFLCSIIFVLYYDLFYDKSIMICLNLGNLVQL